ncbi:hypothetical protein J6590_001877, partial [Homalodisca vitripennis]
MGRQWRRSGFHRTRGPVCARCSSIIGMASVPYKCPGRAFSRENYSSKNPDHLRLSRDCELQHGEVCSAMNT